MYCNVSNREENVFFCLCVSQFIPYEKKVEILSDLYMLHRVRFSDDTHILYII